MPLLLSLAVFDDFRHLVYGILLFVCVEIATYNFVEPWLYGSSTGMSATAIIISAVFWTWLWGPLGLLMSTPLTVCLVVMGKYVPQLRFFDILLGDEPVLSPHVRLYQRLLAFDQEEATDLVDETLKTKELPEVYDTLMVPALALASRDRHEGSLDAEREAFMRRAMREIIDDLGDRHQLPKTQSVTASNQAAPDAASNAAVDVSAPTVNVICLPARDEADEIVALMLAQVLGKNGISARVIPVAALASEMVTAVERAGSPQVVISALPPSAATHARYLCKRLRAERPELSITIGLWTSKQDLKRAMGRLGCTEGDKIVTSLEEAAAHLGPLISATSRPAAIPEPIPA